jgi:3-hydroxyisobutyrate dehydrogenase
MPSINSKNYEPAAAQNVAFLGLGVMGYPMAGHLATNGHQVTVYNRNATKSEAFCAEFTGAKRGLTPNEAVAGADIVYCCVGNDDDLRSVVFGDSGAFAGMKAGAIFVDHTTA